MVTTLCRIFLQHLASPLFVRGYFPTRDTRAGFSRVGYFRIVMPGLMAVSEYPATLRALLAARGG
jgi:hypothetical protein